MFHIGDIVEVAVSFVCFPLRDGYYRMFVALRALILLDNRHREVSVIAVLIFMKEIFCLFNIITLGGTRETYKFYH